MEKNLKQAITAHKDGKLTEAEQLYLEIIKTEPKNPYVNCNLAIILQNQGKFDEAERCCKKAIENKPDYFEAYNTIGIIFAKLNRFNEAIINYKKAIELKPDYAQAYSNLGSSLRDLRKLNEAKLSYKKAIELNPNIAEFHYNLGIILKDLEKLDEALASYKKAIELNPNIAEFHYNLGTILKNLGKSEEAEISLNKAIEIKPDHELALLNKGMLLFSKNEFKNSLKYFDLCNDEESRAYSLSCLYNLGRIKDIYKRIKINSELDEKNLSVAAFSSFISKKEKKNTAHKFCNNPIDFINISNLSSHLKNSNLFINEVIEELKTIETIWEDKTTKNGFHSVNRIDIFENPSEKLKNLKSIIADEIDIYYSKFKNEDCSYIKKWPSRKNIGGWFIILKQLGYQRPHIHPSGWLSGAIYLKVVPHLEKNEGAIAFSLNGWGYSDSNSSKMIHAPVEGDMVLFPSSLHHGTIPYSTDTDRIVISFDLMPKIFDNKNS